MELIIHPTVQTEPQIFVKPVFFENTKTLFLGNQEACIPNTYDHIFSIIDPDTSFTSIQQSHHCFRIYDHSNANIQSLIKTFIETIQHLQGTILVHCGQGISRSPSCILGYMILVHKQTFEEAFSYVQSIVPHIKPNRGFLQYLKQL